jgi:hypothetical protein
MGVTMVRQKIKDGSLEEAEAAVRDLFATLDRVRPEGLRYASTRVVDSSTFVILTEPADGIEDPRPAIPGPGSRGRWCCQVGGQRPAGPGSSRRPSRLLISTCPTAGLPARTSCELHWPRRPSL